MTELLLNLQKYQESHEMSLSFEKLAVLSKNSWVLINCGKDAWSKRTKIIPENKNLECKIPKISEKVYPKERVRI